MNTIRIHETAFVTATYRSSDEALSKDIYSGYWKNPKTDEWIKNYLEKVSYDEPFTHCLRNRYFYETLRRLITTQKIEVLINFGCGFSMYPYLFGPTLMHIEIDQEDIINYKKAEIQKLVDKRKLPERNVRYIAKDFNMEEEALEKEIKEITGNKSSFVLLEGVIFFLSQKVTDSLLALISRIQNPGSYFGSVSFTDQIEGTPCFNRLVHFFKEEVALDNKFEYLTLPTSYYESLPSYKLIEHEDYVSLSRLYSPDKTIEDGDLVLNEHMYLLQRK